MPSIPVNGCLVPANGCRNELAAAYAAGVDGFREYVTSQLPHLQARFAPRHKDWGSRFIDDGLDPDVPSEREPIDDNSASTRFSPQPPLTGALRKSPTGSHRPHSSRTSTVASSLSLSGSRYVEAARGHGANRVSIDPGEVERIRSSSFTPSILKSGQNFSVGSDAGAFPNEADFQSLASHRGLPRQSSRLSHFVTASQSISPSELVASNLELLDIWSLSFVDYTTGSQTSDGNLVMRHRTGSMEKKTSSSSLGLEGRWGDVQHAANFMKPFLVHPDSAKRMVWTVLSCLFIAYDVFCIPLMAFDLPENTTQSAIVYGTAMWWTVDILLTFFVGYHREGIVEMRMIPIAIHYFRTWFVVDLGVSSADWIFIISDTQDTLRSEGENAGGLLRFGKTFRIARLFRLMRLVRLYKMSEALNKMVDSLQSDYWVELLNILKLVVFIVVINHYIACFWYGLAYTNQDDGITWIDETGIKDKPIAFKYAASLHWSLTQFTPATNDIGPKNLRERLFAVTVVLFALVIFSSFVSSITARMTQLRAMNNERIMEETHIREYLSHKRVSLDLGHRIWRFVRKNYDGRKRPLHEHDIAFFSELPTALKQELRKELYLPDLMTAPFFSRYASINMESACHICFTAMSEECHRCGQDFLVEGEPAKKMLFKVSGTLDYFCNGHTTHIKNAVCLSEACLWVKWHHFGIGQAVTNLEMVALDATMFGQAVMIRTPNRSKGARFCRRYAEMFVEAVQALVTGGGLHLTDLPLDQDVLLDIVEKSLLHVEITCPKRGRATSHLEASSLRLSWRRSSFRNLWSEKYTGRTSTSGTEEPESGWAGKISHRGVSGVVNRIFQRNGTSLSNSFQTRSRSLGSTITMGGDLVDRNSRTEESGQKDRDAEPCGSFARQDSPSQSSNSKEEENSSVASPRGEVSPCGSPRPSSSLAQSL